MMADDSDDSFWGQMWWMIPRWVGVTVEEECDKGHSFDPQRLGYCLCFGFRYLLGLCFDRYDREQ